MADLKIETNSFVKWPVKGGMGLGKVIGFPNEKLANIETPSGFVTDVTVESLILASEQEFQNGVQELIDDINKRYGDLMKNDTVKANESNAAEVEAMKQELATLKASLEAAVKEKEVMCAELASVKAEKESMAKFVDETKAKYEEAQKKLDDMTKCSIAKERYAKLKEIGGIDPDEKPEDTLASLKQLDDNSFAYVFKTAQAALKKLTQETQTNQPKTTEQSQTSQPKLTDQTKASENALENAAKESDPSLVTAGSSSEQTNALTVWASTVIGSKSKKNSKK